MGQVHRLAIVLGHQLQTILHHCHHAQAEQVYFDKPKVGTILFVPLYDRTFRHRGTLDRHHMIKLPLADDHTAGVLPQMPRHILQAQTKLQVLGDAGVRDVETGMTKLMIHRVDRSAPLPTPDQTG